MTDVKRRQYWTETMDMAYEFMKNVSDLPVHECMEKLIYLPKVANNAGVDVSFSDKPHVDNLPRLYYLREGLVENFLKVALKFNSCGWVLHVEDAFRTKEMQQKQVCQPFLFDVVLQRCRWEMQDAPVTQQLLFKRMAALIASWPKVATHMSGSAIDISVYDCENMKQIDRGADYLELSELTPMDSPFVSDIAQQNRKQITQIFKEYGFIAYPFEFWHYSSGDIFDSTLNNIIPARYGAIYWNPVTNTVMSLEEQSTPLNSEQDFLRLVATER